MKKKIIALLSVKTIVTILSSIVFCYLSINGTIDKDSFMTIFSVIVAFYFGTQHEKKEGV